MSAEQFPSSSFRSSYLLLLQATLPSFWQTSEIYSSFRLFSCLSYSSAVLQRQTARSLGNILIVINFMLPSKQTLFCLSISVRLSVALSILFIHPSLPILPIAQPKWNPAFHVTSTHTLRIRSDREQTATCIIPYESEFLSDTNPLSNRTTTMGMFGMMSLGHSGRQWQSNYSTFQTDRI